MEPIRAIVRRVLKSAGGSPREEKDYLAGWEEVVAPEVRRHCRAWFRSGRLEVEADNPTTGHYLQLQKEKILAAFKKRRLPLRDLVIRPRRSPRPPAARRS